MVPTREDLLAGIALAISASENLPLAIAAESVLDTVLDTLTSADEVYALSTLREQDEEETE